MNRMVINFRLWSIQFTHRSERILTFWRIRNSKVSPLELSSVSATQLGAIFGQGGYSFQNYCVPSPPTIANSTWTDKTLTPGFFFICTRFYSPWFAYSLIARANGCAISWFMKTFQFRKMMMLYPQSDCFLTDYYAISMQPIDVGNPSNRTRSICYSFSQIWKLETWLPSEEKLKDNMKVRMMKRFCWFLNHFWASLVSSSS